MDDQIMAILPAHRTFDFLLVAVLVLAPEMAAAVFLFTLQNVSFTPVRTLIVRLVYCTRAVAAIMFARGVLLCLTLVLNSVGLCCIAARLVV